MDKLEIEMLKTKIMFEKMEKLMKEKLRKTNNVENIENYFVDGANNIASKYNIYKILNKNNEVEYVVCSAEDITARKEKEKIITDLHKIAIDFKKLKNEKEVCEMAIKAAENIDVRKEYFSQKNQYIKFKLEGYLYPNTYRIEKNFKPLKIYKLMLKEFEDKWLLKLKNKANNSKYNISELVTIASIVEKEAKLVEEKAIIAGVIYNRLEENMKLQIDATVQYVLPRRKERLLYSDLKFDSKYNTYLYAGLPPGPISNPGANSLEAALNPKKTEYLFYFAREDGSHQFSKTYEEHLRKQNELK